jgi:hypothetical protein
MTKTWIVSTGVRQTEVGLQYALGKLPPTDFREWVRRKASFRWGHEVTVPNVHGRREVEIIAEAEDGEP